MAVLANNHGHVLRSGVRVGLRVIRFCRLSGDRLALLDNAAAEAFNSTLKVEFAHRQTFKTRAEARIKISTWIADFYNTSRRHTANHGLAPITFERQMGS